MMKKKTEKKKRSFFGRKKRAAATAPDNMGGNIQTPRPGDEQNETQEVIDDHLAENEHKEVYTKKN